MAAQRLRVLIVDDNKHIRVLVRSMLEALDVDVVECADGESAMTSYREARPDLVILDYEMPGMSGAALTQAIRDAEAGSGRPTAILLMTAHADHRHVTSAAAAGVDGLVAKPLSSQMLLSRAESALRRAEARAGRSPVD